VKSECDPARTDSAACALGVGGGKGSREPEGQHLGLAALLAVLISGVVLAIGGWNAHDVTFGTCGRPATGLAILVLYVSIVALLASAARAVAHLMSDPAKNLLDFSGKVAGVRAAAFVVIAGSVTLGYTPSDPSPEMCPTAASASR
jgi:hypothetical protein